MRQALFCGIALLGLASGVDLEVFEPRSYDGTGNNENNLLWGAAETGQIRAEAPANYDDIVVTATGDPQPSAREVMTDVYRSSPPSVSHMNAVSVAWGQLLLYDLSLTVDNSSEPFDIPCDDGGGSIDIWCPQGESSDPIPFFRSDASVLDSVRNPTNYATSYIDLDFVYGRSEDASKELRTLEGGFMILTESGLPFQNDDGTWLIADQRSAKFPVTLALHAVLLMEHNRCCTEVAPDLGYAGDDAIFEACRGWTIATFQHVTEDEYLIRLLGSSIGDLTVYNDADSSARRLSQAPLPPSRQERRELLFSFDYYDANANPSADVFTVVAVTAAFESALTSTLRVVSEGYVPTDYDQLELTVAGGDIPGLFEKVEIADVLRGAVLAPVLAVDTHYAAAVSNMSPLYKLPVDAVQRGRDHGVPTYNEVRKAYNLSAAADFSEVTSDTDVANLLSVAYGGDIDTLDACTGALAEDKNSVEGGVFGELLHAAWKGQLYRSFFGDRYHHLHSRPIEDVSLVSISKLIELTLNVNDLPASGFEAPGVTVCTEDCDAVGVEGVSLGEDYAISWQVDGDSIIISLKAWGIDDSGMLGIGFGGLSMTDAQDYVICEVTSATEAVCTDRAPTGGRELPELDDVEPDLDVTEVTIDDAGWTTVTFVKAQAPLDEQDYDLGQDIDNEADTSVIFSFKKGAGIGQHPNTNRGDATLNFVTGDVEISCDDGNNFVSLHGALMLIAWMLIAPVGIYFVRYRKGDAVKWAGREWYEMHEEIMIVASEAVLPLGITAVFASRGRTSVAHAHWGYYLIAAVALQIFTGWLRTKGLEAKQSNFSFLHRFNKHFHIWAGRFAYAAGVVQCYRGLELVSSDDQLIFSAGDGLDLQLGSFGWVKSYLFPAWLVLIAGAFLFFETRKQFRRFFQKGSASVCGVVSLVNEMHDASSAGKRERLIPRTEDLPIYSVAAFNDKVLNGQVWVLVDEAILDVSDFAQRHPGGRRLILNGVGTDVTPELVGQDLSVGHAMSFPPHVHSGSAWRIIQSLVIGYIEEKEDREVTGVVEDEVPRERQGSGGAEPAQDNPAGNKERRFRVAGQAVVLLNKRQALGADNLANKAMRLNDIAAIPMRIPAPTMRPPEPTATESTKGSTRTIFAQAPKEIGVPQRGNQAIVGRTSSTDFLQRFQVCPLLFRERMGAASAVGRGHLPSKRPVYRYIFSCPGKVHAQAQAISGVCYFNMRAQEDGKGVVQRAYNAFAVRVQDVEPPTPGGRIKGWRGSNGRGAFKIPKIVPADETTEGVLCIEIRIKMYHDGAMSKIFEKLAKDTDNAVVQLQGPFLIEKLAPPPAHHNVVMIAAGTGVNPMVQQIRDYLSQSRISAFSMRSRLALLWQSTCEADFYGTDEITALQDKSHGLLEVTALVSGGGRKRSAPGAAFRKAKDLILSRNASASPASSTGSSVNPFSSAGPTPLRSRDTADPESVSGEAPAYQTPSRIGREEYPPPPPYKTPTRDGGRPLPVSAEANIEEGVATEKSTPTLGLKGLRKKTWRNAHRVDSASSGSRRSTGILDISTYQVGDGLVQGKVNRELLEKVFGERLMASLASFNRERAVHNLLHDDSDAGDEKDGLDEGDAKGGAEESFVGTNEKPGKLQVVVSGPSEFVFYVGQLLTEMGVPSGSMVLLD